MVFFLVLLSAHPGSCAGAWREKESERERERERERVNEIKKKTQIVERKIKDGGVESNIQQKIKVSSVPVCRINRY